MWETISDSGSRKKGPRVELSEQQIEVIHVKIVTKRGIYLLQNTLQLRFFVTVDCRGMRKLGAI